MRAYIRLAIAAVQAGELLWPSRPKWHVTWYLEAKLISLFWSPRTLECVSIDRITLMIVCTPVSNSWD